MSADIKLRPQGSGADIQLDAVTSTTTTTALVLYLFKTSGYAPNAASYSRSRVVNA